MSIIHQSDATYATTAAKVVGPCTVDYPFKDFGDIVTKIYKHPMKQALANYAPLAYDVVMTAAGAKPDGSPFADDANAFYVGDTNVQPNTAGFVTFEREFANIPQERIEPNGFYAFEFPDVPGGIFFEHPSTSKSFSYNPSNFEFTITATLSASDAAEFTDGEILSIRNTNFWTFSGGVIVSKSAIGGFITKSGNIITQVTEQYYFSGGVKTAYTSVSDNSATSYNVRKTISPDRNDTGQLNSPSVIKYRYVKTSNPDSIVLNEQFKLSLSTGVATTATNTTSFPLTTDEYVQAALNGEYAIAAENESIQRWKGNIYEIAQIMVQPK